VRATQPASLIPIRLTPAWLDHMRGRHAKRKMLKIAVVGETGSGKTAVCRRFLTGGFTDEGHVATDGCYKYSSSVRLDDGQSLGLQMWDTPGSVSFQDIMQGYHPSPVGGAGGVIIVFDGSSKRGLGGLKKWLKPVARLASRTCLVLVLANKLDDHRSPAAPALAKAQRLVGSYGRYFSFGSCSARRGTGLGEAIGGFLDAVVAGSASLGHQPSAAGIDGGGGALGVGAGPGINSVGEVLRRAGLGQHEAAFARAGYGGQACAVELQKLPR
jgi:GTPase SAR1 family protein